MRFLDQNVDPLYRLWGAPLITVCLSDCNILNGDSWAVCLSFKILQVVLMIRQVNKDSQIVFILGGVNVIVLKYNYISVWVFMFAFV